MAKKELHTELSQAIVSVDGLTDQQMVVLFSNFKGVLTPIWDDLCEMIIIHQLQEKMPLTTRKRFTELMKRNEFNYLADLEKYAAK
jgi:hypothetical protein